VSFDEIEAFTWPASRLGDAMAVLISKAGIGTRTSEALRPGDISSRSSAGAWIEWAAKRLGWEAEPVETTFRNLETELLNAHPSLLRLSDSSYLAILDAKKPDLLIVMPSSAVHRISIKKLCEIVREPMERASRGDLERLLRESGIPPARQTAAAKFLINEQFGDRRWNECWVLRTPPGAAPMRWLREAGAIPNGSGLLAAHIAQYMLWLASWAVLGRLSFEGRMDRGWLCAWALLLITLVPFRVLTTWLQGLLAIGIGGFLKRRLLAGALLLQPEEMRHRGIGSFLGQAFEAEAVETLALSGGIGSLLAAIELGVSAFVLGRLALLLMVWCGITVVLAWRFLRRYQQWTDTRMNMTQDLVEAMVGHRTRLAQLRRDQWHESEDQSLDNYLGVSRSLDRTGTSLIAAIPRGWLVCGVIALAPSIISGQSTGTATAILLGGILLAFTAFGRLTGSFADIAAAWVAWKRIAPLFHAAARPQTLGEAVPDKKAGEALEKVIEADRLTFRYRKEGNPVIQGCSLVIRSGERILLEGPSGGGKTTFASLLSGMRQPESGLLLVNGLDRHTLGSERWRQRIAAAPQFHENHILTETLAFNLLMGRRWPPTSADMEEAESICRQLGLGGLLDSMPSGILQMVGEGGWQLSHGERSRVYIARALLQNADLVILDESFAALDPENLRLALQCTVENAETLMVIAHP